MKLLDDIRALLKKRGLDPTDSLVSRILGVHSSTVGRWKFRQDIPWKHRGSLEMLARVLKRAQNDTRAEKIASTLLSHAGTGLLRLGIKGILIAAGLGWITED